MESFKSIEDYPGKPCKELSTENISSYQAYISEAIEQSRCMHLLTWQQMQGKIIHFHQGR